MGKHINISKEERKRKGERFRQMNIQNKGKTLEEIYGKEKAEQIKIKESLASKGKPKSEEMRKKLSLSKTGTKRPPFSEEWIKNMSNSFKRKIVSEETKKRMSLASKGVPKSKEHIKNMKKRWKEISINEPKRNNVTRNLLKNRGISINEQKLLDIIQKNNLPFNFVGDGKVILNGFCPDFLSENPKHIIELCGVSSNRKRITRKNNYYASLGYKTLIIWNLELNNEQKVVQKIQEFIK